MNTQLNERWQSALAPFDGDCLHLNDYVRLPQLRSLMVAIVDVLRQHAAVTPIHRFADWHEHDGYITQQTATDWDAIDGILADDESLYAARQGDAFVRWAYYPADFSFLFRFYTLDADDDPEYPGIWGECNLSGTSELIENSRNAIPSAVTTHIAVTNAKEYFDKNYCG